MRRLLVAALFFGLFAAPATADAQRRTPPPAAPAAPEAEAAPAPEAEPDATAEDATAEEEYDPWADEEDPALEESESSSDEGPAWYEEEAAAAEEADAAADAEAQPIDDAADLLAQAAPQQSDPTRPVWVAPESVFTLHGYLRVRGEFQDSFNLGRNDQLPFSLFTPGDAGTKVDGVGCGSSLTCFNGEDRMRWASMRMRLQPTLAVSDDIRVHMMVDVFDNMVLGSTPNSYLYGYSDVDPTPGGRVPGVPLDSFATTLVPPTAGRNSLQDSILVRRAYAEVANRDIGMLRFGRMGNHWGLGMLFNGGDGIDSDYSSDVDRVQAVTELGGYTLGASWDFVNEGAIRYPNALNAVPMDALDRDDARQFTFFAAHRLDAEEQAARLARGDYVLNGGLYFLYRQQRYTSFRESSGGNLTSTDDPFGRSSIGLQRRGASTFTVDLWGQFLWKSLRLELEAASIVGSVDNIDNGARGDSNKILRFGWALESEYRLLEEKLGIFFNAGYASGDRDVDGLSLYDDTDGQLNDNRRLSNMHFNPNYRVDLILFRNLLGAVGGAWYLKPGIGYDLIRSRFGQLLGIRADAIYSRASREVQTYGSDPNLGLELNGSIYYRTEDGPEFWDGFYASFQYGILFPFAGLNDVDGDLNLDRAQSLRLVMGVQF